MKAEETTQEQHAELISNHEEFLQEVSPEIPSHKLFFEYVVWCRKKDVRHMSEKSFEKVNNLKNSKK